ncbi:hypothetical protein BKA70DRAFT_73358 [Coprinopsis sp. MPI-PUGE-AT-0042]|nr:hypothetical protein BKA70DRAFT_73358 [Coprinopsis sp. MPI-PUGE-AT-0042]
MYHRPRETHPLILECSTGGEGWPSQLNSHCATCCELLDRVNVYGIHAYFAFPTTFCLLQSSHLVFGPPPAPHCINPPPLLRKIKTPRPGQLSGHPCQTLPLSRNIYAPLPLTYVPPHGSLGDPHGAHSKIEGRAGLSRPDDGRVAVEGGLGEEELDSEGEDENCVTRYETPTSASALHIHARPSTTNEAVDRLHRQWPNARR